MLWQSNWKQMDRSMDANFNGGWHTSDEGSHVLDAAVMMGTLGGVATSSAALLLFVGTLRDRPGVSLFVAFGLALLFTMGALVAFLIEMLLASRGLRDQANYASEVGEAHEHAAEGVGESS
jgi:hypothetical protein